ncbi:MAG: hypothetical protein NT169_22505 [Chloroflexi bacterium]|nr:hypothetical protein [Chloroflexota bacterium]
MNRQGTRGEVTGDLIARRADSPPGVSGVVDAVWAEATPLRVPLTWGIRGTEHALDVEVRSLYTADAIYFLAQWPGVAPGDQPDTVANKLTVHWQIAAPAGRPARACDVACHTAFADDQGRIAYANAETIPQGGDATLSVAGGWRDGLWAVEWSRPLVNDNPYDLQFSDLGQSYTFFLKVFERVEGRPDPVSERHQLVFQR